MVIAAIALAVIGLGLYFFFPRHLYNKVPEQAVLTIGIAYIIANVILWIWGPRAQIAQTPEFLTGALKVGGALFPRLPRIHLRGGVGRARAFYGGCRTGRAGGPSSVPVWTTRK